MINEMCSVCNHRRTWIGIKRRRLKCNYCSEKTKKERRKRYINEYNLTETINGIPISDCVKCGNKKKINPYGTIYCKICQSSSSLRYFNKNVENVINYRKEWLKDNSLRPTWSGMNYRCHNKDNKSYSSYGERGISVFEGWRKDNKLSNKDNNKKYLAFKKYIIDTIGKNPDRVTQ